ncbi:hypothetical protein [Jhaorihella thermophila]|uniref:Flp pilus assembly protein, pilin Flp n=1 Tax=Jhaorihella thermophila TaxID=488547 RepID=A0A1H5YPT5_9RHOB|nr:hypothetical protein [Jhaorihella thermophila]SEG26078.1 hypothetical protein SAMN05421751_12120 [Jhaorihella thermophila]
MLKFINKFRKDENGAVTVDWVVLTAAVVALAAAAYNTISSGTTEVATNTKTAIQSADGGESFTPATNSSSSQ